AVAGARILPRPAPRDSRARWSAAGPASASSWISELRYSRLNIATMTEPRALEKREAGGAVNCACAPFHPPPPSVVSVGALHQALDRGPVEVDLVEQLVEIARDRRHVVAEALRKEQADQPLQPEQTVDRRRLIDPAVGQAWTEKHPVVLHGG